MWMAYENGGVWQVRSVSPEEFRQVDEREVHRCFWKQEEASECAMMQNRILLHNAQRSAEVLRASLPESELGGAAA